MGRYMGEPRKFPLALTIGMFFVVGCTFCVSFFGYVAFLDECESPITVNFPMDLLPKILKGLIALMIFITHALNFWVPFNIVFYYLKPHHKPEKIVQWELMYRALFVVLIGIVAILFPNINSLMGLQPSGQTSGNFKLLAHSQEEEDAFDYVKHRTGVKPTGVVGSIAHMVKGALGAGILSGHVAYMKIGLYAAVPLNFIFGIYMGYCLYMLVHSAQILYRRTRCTSMTYSDVGEAAMACCPCPRLATWSKVFRITIDVVISIDLFGSCACYQIIIAKSIKQLVENTHKTALEGQIEGYPSLRLYMASMIIPIILICLIQHLKYLAPFSLAANVIIAFCIGMAVYYAFQYNPNFENIVGYTKLYHLFEFVGMSVFSMSCSGVVIPIENNMSNPRKFPLALAIGMCFVIGCTFSVSFFGYIGFLDKCESPITVNFPMDTLPKVLKGLIAFMIFVTHALNFWVPFNICFYYLKKHHDPNNLFMWEMIYRTMFVIMIALVAIAFPTVDNLIGFIGSICLSNMAFIWPNVISLLVIWERPGLGKFRWRLWKHVILITVGMFILVCGGIVNGTELVKTLFA